MNRHARSLLVWIAPILLGHAAPSTQASTPEDHAPDVTLLSASGQEVKLSNWVGKKPVVLLFMRGFVGDFACFFCGAQTSDYQASYEKFGAAGAEVLMILPGVKGREGATGYVKGVGLSAVSFPLLLDPDLSACRAYQVPTENAGESAFPVNEPATIVIGKDSSVLFAYHGKNPSDRPSVDAVLDVLRGKAPATPSSSTPRPLASVPSLAWVPFDEGMNAAREAKKPILLEFYADW